MQGGDYILYARQAQFDAYRQNSPPDFKPRIKRTGEDKRGQDGTKIHFRNGSRKVPIRPTHSPAVFRLKLLV